MKILYSATISNTINRFLIDHIEMLISLGHTVDIACKIDKPINKKLLDLGCKVYNIPFSRNVLFNNIFTVQNSIYNLVKNQKYDVIHVHTPIASALVRNSIKRIKNVKVVYTAHGFHFYEGAPLKNWIIYYPIEKYLSKFTDLIITINREDYVRTQNFSPNKVSYVPGVGLDLKRNEVNTIKEEKLRNEFSIHNNQLVLLSVGELNHNKNHEIIIKSLANLRDINFKYIICGEGKLRGKLQKLIKKYRLDDKVILAGYRTNISDFMKICDVFIFPSFREGLSVALMEAMASGLPIICSDIRGNKDLIIANKGGYLINPKGQKEFELAIKKMLNNKEQRITFGEFNKEKINEFSKEVVLEKIQEIFDQINKENLIEKQV